MQCFLVVTERHLIRFMLFLLAQSEAPPASTHGGTLTEISGFCGTHRERRWL